ncbi:FliM/FliN family flagellar motor switch protein [Clostridium sp. CCUG 7971]|uniref:FliM/FliN family flagellar motor switch protein n=1 Tax=Clostridium sp. CCUG 7971 TaxID=2811414 RepID=UPI001ABAB9B8|nr:FliM/FliN family flagellar motor switch protein [Clostridium sp. CCUG 7971]MBO3445084.1 FliM/FliN family flagellar motor switch protein [Clostridium sp. CCUG 7971]
MNDKFGRVLDIPLKVTAILGRTKMNLKDIFELTKGSLIELNTFENQEVEIFVNGQKIAYGQVVIVDQNFGVRITSILGEEELAKTLA